VLRDLGYDNAGFGQGFRSPRIEEYGGMVKMMISRVIPKKVGEEN
jgi:hypothetical protein